MEEHQAGKRKATWKLLQAVDPAGTSLFRRIVYLAELENYIARTRKESWAICMLWPQSRYRKSVLRLPVTGIIIRRTCSRQWKWRESPSFCRPMNCPHHMMIYANKCTPTKILPIRIGEIAHDFPFRGERYVKAVLREEDISARTTRTCS